MKTGTVIFEDRKNKSKVEVATDVRRSRLELPMNITNDFTAILTNVVTMKVPGELICKPHTQQIGGMHTIDRLAIESEGEIREWVMLGGYNHHFRFRGVCSEVVIGNHASMMMVSD